MSEISRELHLTLQAALREAVVRRNPYLTVEHLLFALAHDRRGEEILVHSGASLPALKAALEKFLRDDLEHVPGDEPIETRQTLAFHRVLRHAISHCESAEKEEVEIRLAMRNAHLATGELDAIPGNLHRALTLAEELDDILWRTRVTSGLAHYHWLRRELSQAFSLAHRAVDLAELTGDAAEVTLARGVLGRAHWARGEYGPAATTFQKCLEIESSEIPRGMSALIAIPSVVSPIERFSGKKCSSASSTRTIEPT